MHIIGKNPVANLFNDRDKEIEIRIGSMYMAVGLLAAMVGFVISILCHAKIYGMMAVIGIVGIVFCTVFIGMGTQKLRQSRNVLLIMLLILLPIIFINAGGVESGCPAWFLYELYFITLACSGDMLFCLLCIAIISDVALCVADFLGWKMIYKLPTSQDVMISTTLSWIVVAVAILVTVLAYKAMYNEERQSLLIQSKELERANQFEKRFLANMSHELRTPINSIIGFDEMIKRKSADSEILEYAIDIGTATDHLLSLVNDILDLSKIDSGELYLNNCEYDIRDLVTNIYDLVKNRIEDKRLEFEVEIQDDVPSVLKGDKDRIVQIALNLLSNAIKYTSVGRISFVVKAEKIENEPNQTMLMFTVRDTGMGISKENLEGIFVEYRRVDKRVSNIQGTGLGLAITKHLTQAMGGGIFADSIVDVGSTFSAYFKQEIVDATPCGDYDVIVTKNSAIPTVKVSTTDEKKAGLILVVDDTQMNLKVIRSLLEDSGYTVICAESGERAINFVKHNPVDLILMDIMMPEMDGVETMEKIWKIVPDIKAVALTANAINGARDEYLSVGFADYLAKPVKPLELEKMVKKYL